MINSYHFSHVQYKESENVWSIFGECAVNSTEGWCQDKIFDISVRLKNQIH
jgi:hypothetical protein